MKIIGRAGSKELAEVFLADTGEGRYLEFVHSLQPPFTRKQKWVFIISTLYGCPVGCSICDAGGWYKGRVSTDDMLAQILYLKDIFYSDREIDSEKFKIQFARMGEPVFNPNVLELLRILPEKVSARNIIPSFSTIGPLGIKSEAFFKELTEIKRELYNEGNFQMQFSIHSTDTAQRDELIPVKKMSFSEIAAFGKDFYSSGDRKITLNFALHRDSLLSADILERYFDKDIFLIKLTPVNPTLKAIENGVKNIMQDERDCLELDVYRKLRDRGFDVIVSIGEMEENKIGSNCGQYIKTFLEKGDFCSDKTYTYKVAEKVIS